MKVVIDDSDDDKEIDLPLSHKGTGLYSANFTVEPLDDILGNLRPAGAESDVGAVEVGARELPGGDINADNTVNVLDIQLCVNVVIGLEANPSIVANSDINDDGRVSTSDVDLLVELVLR